MQTYSFLTQWHFKAPIEKVWNEVSRVETWPASWKQFRKADIRNPDRPVGIGTVVDCEVTAGLLCSFRFTVEVTGYEPPHLVELKASGDLVGSGTGTLAERDGGTDIGFQWDVGTTSALLCILARFPFAQRVLRWNHERVMNLGYRALKAKVEGD